jgi:transcription antitermination factor NusB
MAMQMLYQYDMGVRGPAELPLQEIFSSFDVAGYEDFSVGDDAAADALAAEAEPTATVTPLAPRATGSDRGEPEGPFAELAEMAGKAAAERDAGERPSGPQGRRLLENAFDYARRLVEGTLQHTEIIDQMIRSHAENWRLERMPTIDRNILRLAIYEMLHEESVPKVVIVDEAIELAKKFGSENSGRFVNGLLDGVLQSEALGERLAGEQIEPQEVAP